MRLATLLVVLVGAAMLRRYGYRERPEAAASDEVQPSPFLTTRVGDASQYNVSRAKHSVDMAGAAYCSGNVGHGVSTWSCKVCKRYPGVEATEVSDKPTNANGFVAYDALDGPRGAIYVSFAGTDPLSIRDWIDDIDFVHEAVQYYTDNGCSGCEVHSGFYAAYDSVRSQVLDAVAKYAGAHPGVDVRVTGHSLGAAIATHCAADLAIQGYNVTDVYTFGQPRVGNRAFAAWYDGKFKGRHWRVTHSHDPVPHLPPQNILGDFRHVPREVYYPKKSDGDFTVCDGSGEDNKCSNGNLADINVADHLEYCGFGFTTNYISCKA